MARRPNGTSTRSSSTDRTFAARSPSGELAGRLDDDAAILHHEHVGLYRRHARRQARLAQHYDLSQTRVVIGGDAANWVKQGQDHFAEAPWQLDRFHLARPLHRVLPEDEAVKAYRAARRGDQEAALEAVRWRSSRYAARPPTPSSAPTPTPGYRHPSPPCRPQTGSVRCFAGSPGPPLRGQLTSPPPLAPRL